MTRTKDLSRAFHLDRQGLSLVEIMIGLAIGVVGLFGAAALLMNAQGSLDGNKLAMSRDEVLMFLRRALGNPVALSTTAIVTDTAGATINPGFKSCMSGQAGTVCKHGQPLPIQVYDRMKTLLSGPYDTVTNQPDRPMRYDANGRPCPIGSSSAACPIAISTYFTPNCSPYDLKLTPGLCAKAEYIEVFYLVAVDPSATAKQAMRPITGSIFISQQEFPQF